MADRWEHFAHEADMGIRAFAATKASAYAQAALAMTAVITDPDLVLPSMPVNIRCEAPDDELLLADWLNALVFEMATRDMLFSRFEVAIDDHFLSATAWGEAVDRKRHHPAVEVKAATYTELDVSQLADGTFRVQCVLDV